ACTTCRITRSTTSATRRSDARRARARQRPARTSARGGGGGSRARSRNAASTGESHEHGSRIASKPERRAMSGFVVWFTGMSGAGKSTIANALQSELTRRGRHSELLDGDEVRTHLSKGLGFTKEDRDTNIRRIGYVARLSARSGGVAITAAISPYREVRDEVRAETPGFVEVFVRAPLETLVERDTKGLYR